MWSEDSLESLILFSHAHGGGCETGFQSEHRDPEQLLGLSPQVAILAAPGKLQEECPVSMVKSLQPPS